MNSNSQLDQSQQKIRRRTRNDQNERNFYCGCGKSYLSYPALYTHLKQKHQGKPPQGTMLLNNLGTRGNRGRPRVKEELDCQFDSNKEEEKSLSSNQPEETLEELLLFIESIGSQFRDTQSKLQNKKSFLINEFPINVVKDSQEADQILIHIRQILNQLQFNIELQIKKEENESEEESIEQQLYEDELDFDKNIRKTVIYKVFAYFLIELGSKLTNQAYKEMCIFIVFFAKALNELGYDAAVVYEQQMMHGLPQKFVSEMEGKFCENKNGDQILLISNEFILQLLPKYFEQINQDEEHKLKIFGGSDEKLKNAVYVTQHFSYWLYSRKFTNSRLALYTDEE